jgi:hypothetical protein
MSGRFEDLAHFDEQSRGTTAERRGWTISAASRPDEMEYKLTVNHPRAEDGFVQRMVWKRE